jgi:formate hydrogenlyase subunit 4
VSALLGSLALLLHAALMLAAAPFLAGLIRMLTARLLGRAGPPLLQPWRELRRLLRKQPVLAESASAVFLAAPAIALAALFAAVLLVPSFSLGMLTAPVADLVAIAGLILLARAALALAAMDVGTTPGGVGAARAMAEAALAEPALLLLILGLALLAGSTNLDAVVAVLREAPTALRATIIPAVAAIVLLALAVDPRLAGGDPGSLALSGTGPGGGALEYSGRLLALLRFAEALRLTLWLTLVAALVPYGPVPAEAGPALWPLGILAWAVKLVVLAGGIAVCDATMARLRWRRVPAFIGSAAVLALLAVLFALLGLGAA